MMTTSHTNGAPRSSRARSRVGVVLAGSAATLMVGLLAGPALAAQAASAPHLTDPEAHGAIGFCNEAGREITSGKVGATPFVWRAISTVPAPSGYAGAGRTATLFAYQPRVDVPSGDWSGASLTASAEYSDSAHPEAAATRGDESLADFTADFAPQEDGLLQLRLFLGAPDEQPYSETYPATVIQVTGKTWHVVGQAPTVSCTSEKARSLESVVLSKGLISGHNKNSHQGSKQPIGSSSTSASKSGHHPGGTASAKNSSESRHNSSSARINSNLSADTATAHQSSNSDLAVIVIASFAACAVIAMSARFGLRRRALSQLRSSAASAGNPRKVSRS